MGSFCLMVLFSHPLLADGQVSTQHSGAAAGQAHARWSLRSNGSAAGAQMKPQFPAVPGPASWGTKGP